MDCTRFEELWFAALDGPHTGAEARRVYGAEETARRAHAAGCARCSALERLVSAAATKPEAEPPEDLLESILAATSPAWARTFARLDRELPDMAEVRPDPTFVADVLAATSGAAPSDASATALQTTPARPTAPIVRRRPASPRLDRLATAWEALVRRPRLAFEGAYVGAVVLMLVVGTPAWSLSVSPAELLTEIRADRVEPAVQSVNQRVEPVVQSVSDYVVPVVASGRSVAGAATNAWSSVGALGTEFWSNTVEAGIERGRTYWCDSFGCEPPQPVDPETDTSRRNP